MEGLIKQLNSIRFLYSDGESPVLFLKEVEKPNAVSTPTSRAISSTGRSVSASRCDALSVFFARIYSVVVQPVNYRKRFFIFVELILPSLTSSSCRISSV